MATLASANRPARRHSSTNPAQTRRIASPDYGWAQPSAPSASSATPPNGNETNVLGDATLRTVNGVADDRADAGYGETGATVRANLMKPYYRVVHR